MSRRAIQNLRSFRSREAFDGNEQEGLPRQGRDRFQSTLRKRFICRIRVLALLINGDRIPDLRERAIERHACRQRFIK
jgi:hypothetical protein